MHKTICNGEMHVSEESFKAMTWGPRVYGAGKYETSAGFHKSHMDDKTNPEQALKVHVK